MFGFSGKCYVRSTKGLPYVFLPVVSGETILFFFLDLLLLSDITNKIKYAIQSQSSGRERGYEYVDNDVASPTKSTPVLQHKADWAGVHRGAFIICFEGPEHLIRGPDSAPWETWGSYR